MIASLNIVLEVSCLLFALYFLKGNKSVFAKATLGYLVAVCLIEITGLVWIKTLHTSNAWVYNIQIIFEATYISYGLYVALNVFTNRAKLLTTGTFALFAIAYTYELVQHGFFVFNAFTIALVSVPFVLLCLYYYYLFMKQDQTANLKTNGQFWWITAILFYYFGGTAYNLFNYLIFKNGQHSFIILTYVMLFLNVLLYGIWAYSFLCSSRQQKLSEL